MGLQCIQGDVTPHTTSVETGLTYFPLTPAILRCFMAYIVDFGDHQFTRVFSASSGEHPGVNQGQVEFVIHGFEEEHRDLVHMGHQVTCRSSQVFRCHHDEGDDVFEALVRLRVDRRDSTPSNTTSLES